MCQRQKGPGQFFLYHKVMQLQNIIHFKRHLSILYQQINSVSDSDADSDRDGAQGIGGNVV